MPHLRADFPGLVRYCRLVSLIPSLLFPLAAYLEAGRGPCHGLSLVDPTQLVFSHHRRLQPHRASAGLAARSQDSVDWFYGCTRPGVGTACGGRLAGRLAPGNVADRRPLPELAKRLLGNLVGDTGSLSPDLVARRLQSGGTAPPITHRRKPRLVRLTGRLLLRQRALLETSNDPLKTRSHMEQRRQRSPANFLVNVLTGLLAYCHQPKQPSLHITPEVLTLMGR